VYPCSVLGLIQVSDYKDDGTNILLDANENAYGPGLALDSAGKQPGANVNGTSDSSLAIDVDLLGLNRYPDPYVVPRSKYSRR
jgi:histidinol-phosphate aminotransferase